ncbi:MAG: hypothetical protein VB092_08775 [Oscillospiraceae bacterium]|nr:hypothetical protein [Oscillospiraceae bacterium]
MLSAKIKKAARELGLANRYGILYGTVNGYVVSISEAGAGAELFVDAHTAQLSADAAASLRKALEDVAQTYGVAGLSLTKTGVRSALPKDKNAAADCTEFIYALLNQLKIACVPGASVCSNCAKPVENGAVVKVGAHAHSCCAECAERIVNTRRRKKDKSKKHAFAGFFGALFAGVIGLAPWAYLNYLGYYALPALFLVPLAASFGYRIFGGRPCAAKAVIVSVLSLLVYAAGCALLLGWSVYMNWWNSGYTFSRAEIIDAVLAALRAPDAMMTALLRDNIAMGLIFIALGLLFVVPGALKNNAHYTALRSEVKHG